MTQNGPRDPGDELGDAGSLFIEDQHFAVIQEWVIDSGLSDAAFRVYTLLLRYGNGSGCRMPSRALLARRLQRSMDSVDRAMKELVAADVVRVQRRHDGRQNLSNRYHVRTSDPATGENRRSEGSRKSAATPVEAVGGSRKSAATPGRRSAARVAANVRPYREIFTDTPPPPPSAEKPAAAMPTGNARAEEEANANDRLLADCRIEDLDELAARCAAARLALGQPTTRWVAQCLLPAIQLAVRVREWPAHLVVPALLAVAGDPETRSPMRLAEPGPWWDAASATGSSDGDDAELAELELRLLESDGLRPVLQARARAELSAQGLPQTRSTVVRRAVEILERRATG